MEHKGGAWGGVLGLGEWDIEGLAMAGRVLERQHLGEYIVGKASGPRHLLRRQREELGKVSPAMGVGRGSFICRERHLFACTERHVIYTEKEQEIKAGRGE